MSRIDASAIVAPRWHTVKEYADLIRVNQYTVYAWIAEDRLAGVERFGRSIRIDPARAFVKRAQPHPNTPKAQPS